MEEEDPPEARPKQDPLEDDNQEEDMKIGRSANVLVKILGSSSDNDHTTERMVDERKRRESNHDKRTITRKRGMETRSKTKHGNKTEEEQRERKSPPEFMMDGRMSKRDKLKQAKANTLKYQKFYRIIRRLKQEGRRNDQGQTSIRTRER